MALARRSTQRISTSIWPGFVDAITALVLVLFFVLSIFMIVQFVLRDTIIGQEGEIDTLAREIAGLADALGLAQAEAAEQEELVATLAAELDIAMGEITGFEAQVAALVTRNLTLAVDLQSSEERLVAAQAELSDTETRLAEAEAERGAAFSRAATAEEQAELVAARTRALDALVASLRAEREAAEAGLTAREAELAATAEALDEAEAARIAEAAAAELLRERLQDSQAELTALTLSLEEERARAEQTLTLLAASRAAQSELEAVQAALQASEAEAMTEAERQAALRAQAEALLAEQAEVSTEAQRQVALLNQQTAALRDQLDALQALLADTRGVAMEALTAEAEAQAEIDQLGARLNSALARLAEEQRVRADLEARERERLEAEARDLERYRSEFFGRMSAILGEREGVQVVGDRFVFQSEVLFPPGAATLGTAGQQEVARVASVIRDISEEVPPEIDWILRVDGHTDQIPVSPGGQFRDNWELSQARALSVVRLMIEQEGVPPDRLAANGFGEYQPIDPGLSPDALARNRRIELKFTER